jgi:hypothetical protein
MWDASHARSGRAADLIDYCIHRYCDGTHCSDSKLNPRWVCLLAIGERGNRCVGLRRLLGNAHLY